MIPLGAGGSMGPRYARMGYPFRKDPRTNMMKPTRRLIGFMSNEKSTRWLCGDWYDFNESVSRMIAGDMEPFLAQ